jgi:hypothetical protein
MMRLSKAFVTLALTWLATIAHAVDLSYNGLAITPQMGWVCTSGSSQFSIHSLANWVGLRTIGTPLLVTSTRNSSCHLQRRWWIGAFETLDTTTLSWTTAVNVPWLKWFNNAEYDEVSQWHGCLGERAAWDGTEIWHVFQCRRGKSAGPKFAR